LPELQVLPGLPELPSSPLPQNPSMSVKDRSPEQKRTPLLSSYFSPPFLLFDVLEDLYTNAKIKDTKKMKKL